MAVIKERKAREGTHPSEDFIGSDLSSRTQAGWRVGTVSNDERDHFPCDGCVL